MASTTNPTLIKDLAGTVKAGTAGKAEVTRLVITNTNASTTFVQIFDALTANVTLGTTVPLVTIPVVATTGNYTLESGRFPWLFDTQMSVAATTTALGLTGSGTGVYVTVWVN